MKPSPLGYIRLSDAAAAYGLSLHTLRAQRDCGRLAVWRVGREDWTTEAALKDMFEKCRVAAKEPGSISAPPAPAKAGDIPASGSSSTGEPSAALVSAQRIAQALKKPSPTISRQNTSPSGANVLSMRSK